MVFLRLFKKTPLLYKRGSWINIINHFVFVNLRKKNLYRITNWGFHFCKNTYIKTISRMVSFKNKLSRRKWSIFFCSCCLLNVYISVYCFPKTDELISHWVNIKIKKQVWGVSGRILPSIWSILSPFIILELVSSTFHVCLGEL